MFSGLKSIFTSSQTKNLEKYKKMKPNNVINSIGNLGRFDNYKDEDGNTILHIAIKENWIPVVRMLLLNQKANYFNSLNNDRETPLILAIKNNNIEILKLLLENSKIDLKLKDKDGITPMMWYMAIMNNESYSTNIENIKKKLEGPKNNLNFKDVNSKSILDIAIKKNNIYILRILLLIKDSNYLNSLNKDGITPLILAIQYSKIEIVKMLLDNPNIDINIQDKNGHTALIHAITNNKIEIVKMLLDHPNIDINFQNKNGNTALIHAISNNKIEIVKMLLDHPNIDINFQNKNEYTALIYAIDQNNIEILKILLDNPNIDVNNKNKFGHTALTYAIFKNKIDCIKMLLYHPNIDNHERNILHFFEKYLSDSDSINFIKIITMNIINMANSKNMKKSKMVNTNNNSSSSISRIKLKKNLIESPKNLNFIDIDTLEYFKQQHKNNGINKNVLTEIRKLMIDDNQGMITGHGATLPNEVCLIPDNLALFFPVQKSCILYSSELNFNNRKNTRKKLVNKKLKNKTGKILPGGTIISNMIINFERTWNNTSKPPLNRKDIVRYSYGGIITKNLYDLGNNFSENDQLNKSIRKNTKFYENELKNINIKLKRLSELNLENEEFISLLNYSENQKIQLKKNIKNINKKSKNKKNIKKKKKLKKKKINFQKKKKICFC